MKFADNNVTLTYESISNIDRNPHDVIFVKCHRVIKTKYNCIV